LAILRAVGDPASSYSQLVTERLAKTAIEPWYAHQFVVQVVQALQQMQLDAEAGLLARIEARVSAENFDDLLDHAAQYLADGRHEPAGVLAGVVFEDTIRRLCDSHGIEHRDKELDAAMNALKAKGVLTKLEQKEGITAADLRGNATHANWQAFKASQVTPVIDFTRRLIREKLATEH
jgi:hypothetical protein